ncbi:hypothetical protein COS91_05505 [Candidatus Desantisbacteria bacterium CG07_land_8_20_14_0_80_39_15]|uniref:ATPase n=1 Tax=Candidatus Desantisbacteria bacterium CG07_land_8_20_14_0_80_39_15 TaxID=1974549 RepID=A0A2M6ZFT5_9BACT|nr:MAG: hypothetical protein COS91_05505 [Candidatus Desantisbacteria bacterium CG07_land_8_20_14_0_80_39_15]
MIIKRDLIETLKPFLKRKEFISIVGPRQSGKSTFLGILKDYLCDELKVKKFMVQILTFEDRKLFAQFDADPVAFINSYIPANPEGVFYLMIDEFQYSVNGGQKLKLIYDTVKNVRIFITGSSSLDIKAQASRFMVGRMLNFYLFPFNFGEFLKVKNKRMERIYYQNSEEVFNLLFKERTLKEKSGSDVFSEEMIKLYEEFCIWGGYPAVILSKNENERKKVIADIYNGYVLKDIKTLLDLATENNLYLLSQYLATQTGNITVYQNLCQTSGLNHRNLKKHLNILKETFICREVKPFFKNRQKELSKNPKIYFIDMGFRNNLMENMIGLEKRSDAGAIIENSVFIRLNELCENMEKINFWRTKAGAEVDFVLHVRENAIPIEVKYSNFDSEKISKSLASFIDSFKPGHAVVLTKNYWGSSKRDKTKIFFAPVYYI